MTRIGTKDTWLAAYLLCKGGVLDSVTIIPGTRTAILNIIGDGLDEIREDFFCDDSVPAMSYKCAVNNLKKEIFVKLEKSDYDRKKSS